MSPEETATFRYVLHLIVGVLIVSILIVGCSRCVYSHYCENVLIVPQDGATVTDPSQPHDGPR